MLLKIEEKNTMEVLYYNQTSYIQVTIVLLKNKVNEERNKSNSPINYDLLERWNKIIDEALHASRTNKFSEFFDEVPKEKTPFPSSVNSIIETISSYKKKNIVGPDDTDPKTGSNKTEIDIEKIRLDKINKNRTTEKEINIEKIRSEKIDKNRITDEEIERKKIITSNPIIKPDKYDPTELTKRYIDKVSEFRKMSNLFYGDHYSIYEQKYFLNGFCSMMEEIRRDLRKKRRNNM